MNGSTARRGLFALCLLAGSAAAQEAPPDQPPLWHAQPDIAAFEKAENDRLAAAEAAIAKIRAVQGARTIANTLVPYDEAMRELGAAEGFAGLMENVHPDAQFRDHATAMSTRISGAATAVSLDRGVYRALAAVDLRRADAATRYYVQRQLLEFRLSGVDRDDATRAKLKALDERLTGETSMFERNIADATATVRLPDAAALAGLPQDFIDSHRPGADGTIAVTTNYPDLIPVLQYADSDATRRSLWVANNDRAWPANGELLRRILQTRYEIATLLGYRSWADYNAADKMIGSGAGIAQFIADLDRATRPQSQREFALLLEEKRRLVPDARQLDAYETSYFSERVRRARYGFDSGSLRPYLPYDAVRQGIFDTAARLFHVGFRREPDAPAWDPAVETWDVIEDGRMTGRFYLDMHPRPGKYNHAAHFRVLQGIRGRQLPEAALVCNFPAPTATDPGLMEYSDVVSFFHEFGHLMHHILGGRQSWYGIAGITMEHDFVEAPSQMLEELMHSPAVLASFARHYQTGAPIPAELVAAMNRATAFGRASFVARQNSLSAISYDIYKAPPRDVDLGAVTLRDLARYSQAVPLASDAHFHASFGHLAGYSSAYYTYMWDKVIAVDFFSRFDPRDPLAGDTPLRYRRSVLEPGGSMPARDLVRGFLGRPQSMQAFERWMGEEFADGTPPREGSPRRDGR